MSTELMIEVSKFGDYTINVDKASGRFYIDGQAAEENLTKRWFDTHQQAIDYIDGVEKRLTAVKREKVSLPVTLIIDNVAVDDTFLGANGATGKWKLKNHNKSKREHEVAGHQIFKQFSDEDRKLFNELGATIDVAVARQQKIKDQYAAHLGSSPGWGRITVERLVGIEKDAVRKLLGGDDVQTTE